MGANGTELKKSYCYQLTTCIFSVGSTKLRVSELHLALQSNLQL